MSSLYGFEVKSDRARLNTTGDLLLEER